MKYQIASRKSILSLVVAALTVGLAVRSVCAEPEAVRNLDAALSCDHDFRPENVLEGLLREGVIGPKPQTIVDGIPVFAVVKPVKVRGLTVRFVQGWDFTGTLFTRAPGTAPGTFLSITVNGSKRDVERKIFDDSGSGEKQDSSYYLFVDDRPAAYAYKVQQSVSEVICKLPDHFPP